MFIEFSIGNFRSFKEIVTLSLVAANLKAKNPQLDEGNVFTLPSQPDLLTSAVIYGANASGKSNLVAALNFMRGFVLDSPNATQATGAIGVERFRLNTQTENEPTHCEAVFVVDGLRYRYGFTVTPERVESEWLFVVPTTREALLFERKGDGVVLGQRFGEGKEIIERTRPNALFLSVVAQFNGKIAQQIVHWFRQMGIASGLDDVGMYTFTIQHFRGGDYASDILALIQFLDMGIEKLEVKSTELPRFQPNNRGESLRNSLLRAKAEDDGEFFTVRSTHRKFNSEGEPAGVECFDFDAYESEGTKKLFALAGPIAAALRQGRVLVIDELDARLHPLLTSTLVRLFNSRETNPHHAQLIFTTHDINLLGSDLFRRDQVWFTEKDRVGATALYSLAEFRVRNDASFERDYLKGRYGAIPFLGDMPALTESR